MNFEKNKVDLGIEILSNGPICMYYKNNLLNEDINWFSNRNYEVFDINTKNWTSKNAHTRLKNELGFPDYYGENLNAFDDCLDDMLNPKYEGLILIFRNFDDFVFEDHKFAEGILDIIAYNSRSWLVKGKKLITLIQSNNPNLHFQKLGGVKPFWNSSEWFDSDRKK